ncbi:MAG: type II toxin-antitoxin system HicB family antitoxin [Nitrospiraceae bacterium]|nr:MAG: type II toxin-antitoxin system HicB family antitoxin [Nitrospiraceae bacterium]
MKELTVSRDDTGEWLVTSREIPGFIARGKTQQEALDKMKQAFKIYFPCGSDNCREGE